MNDYILTDEQWSELWEAVKLSDQKGDRTILYQVLGWCDIISHLIIL
jgi:hypothetical protein